MPEGYRGSSHDIGPLRPHKNRPGRSTNRAVLGILDGSRVDATGHSHSPPGGRSLSRGPVEHPRRGVTRTSAMSGCTSRGRCGRLFPRKGYLVSRKQVSSTRIGDRLLFGLCGLERSQGRLRLSLKQAELLTAPGRASSAYLPIHSFKG